MYDVYPNAQFALPSPRGEPAGTRRTATQETTLGMARDDDEAAKFVQKADRFGSETLILVPFAYLWPNSLANLLRLSPPR